MHPTPSFTRLVAAESAPSSAIDSGRGLAITLSPTQTESNSGLRSASRAVAIICGHEAIPKNTPRCGIVNPKLTRSAIVFCSALGIELEQLFQAGRLARAGVCDGCARPALGFTVRTGQGASR